MSKIVSVSLFVPAWSLRVFGSVKRGLYCEPSPKSRRNVPFLTCACVRRGKENGLGPGWFCACSWGFLDPTISDLTLIYFRTPFGRECEVVAKTEVDSHKAETPSNHWVFLTREVKDAAREHELEREQEFKDLLTRQQAAEAEGVPPKEEIPGGSEETQPGGSGQPTQ